MHVIVTNNKELLRLAERLNEQVFDLSKFNLVISEQVAERQSQVDLNVFMHNTILELLISLNIPTHLKGFTYLLYAIKFELAEPNTYIFSSDIYIKIADFFKVSPGAIKNAIRDVIINHVFGKKRSELLSIVFPKHTGESYLTNNEFIYGIKTYLEKEYGF